MKGGGLEFHIPILKNDSFKNHLESFPDCENLLTYSLSLGFLLCIYSSWDDFEHGSIVGSQRPDLLMNVNFEPIIRGLKSDIFEV